MMHCRRGSLWIFILLLSGMLVFQVVSPGMAYVFYGRLPRQHMRQNYQVALIDTFYQRDQRFDYETKRQFHLLINDAFDIDNDGIRDAYYHGDIVSIFAKHPALKILPYHVENLAQSKQTILKHLTSIKGEIDAGRRIDAVLLPWESSTLISAFDTVLKPEQAERYLEILRHWGEHCESWQLSYRIIRALEALSARGVTVFTIAGNAGSRMVNTYSFAKGVIAVGGEEPDDDGRWITHNAVVDTVAQSVYHVRRVVDKQGRCLGYDINEDGLVDIPDASVSSHRQFPQLANPGSLTILKGSSFAAPTKLRMIINTLNSYAMLYPAVASFLEMAAVAE